MGGPDANRSHAGVLLQAAVMIKANAPGFKTFARAAGPGEEGVRIEFG